MKLSEYLYQKRHGESRHGKRTLQEVADSAGLSKGYICRIESGVLDNNQISLDTFIKLCRALGDDPIEVLTSLISK